MLESVGTRTTAPAVGRIGRSKRHLTIPRAGSRRLDPCCVLPF
ncbi:hypothetical protein ACH492_24455 [Streptomyces sp. NPDC019443]